MFAATPTIPYSTILSGSLSRRGVNGISSLLLCLIFSGFTKVRYKQPRCHPEFFEAKRRKVSKEAAGGTSSESQQQDKLNRSTTSGIKTYSLKSDDQISLFPPLLLPL